MNQPARLRDIIFAREKWKAKDLWNELIKSGKRVFSVPVKNREGSVTATNEKIKQMIIAGDNIKQITYKLHVTPTRIRKVNALLQKCLKKQ